MESDDSISNDEHSCDFVARNSNNTSFGTLNNPKTGRKGDPRMHCAVGARLANPKISLFGALKIGGFEYENDDDSNAVDSENITLAQRKNQLSRRIRLAQKSQGSNSNMSDCSGSTTVQDINRERSAKMTCVEGDNFNKPKIVEPLSNDNGLLSDRSLSGSGSISTAHKKRSGCATDSYPLRARQHPDFHPLVVPMLQRGGPSGSMSTSMDKQESQKLNQHAPTIGIIHSDGIPDHQKARFPASYSNTTQQPSAVAISSISHTAASVGMSLEQLALALRNSNNLSQILNSGPSAACQQKQLALSLYQSENRSLYQKAMLMAGYSPDIAHNEHSPGHVQFAMEAWKLEGERLSGVTIECSDHKRRVKANATNSHNGSIEQINSLNCRANDDSTNAIPHPHPHHFTHHDKRNNFPVQPKRKANEIDDRVSGRHVHLLDGNCGHQPVLHQPSGGKPHIDFVVGDQVECYHDLQPSQALTWLSNDTTTCDNGDSQIDQSGSASNLVGIAPITGGEPRIYDRREIDFDTDEWNFDFTTSDSLLGLFKLGDSKQQSQQT